MSEQASCDPTEKTLYQEPHSDHYGTWQDRLYICGQGPRHGIGISVGGEVFVMPLKAWHDSAKGLTAAQELIAKLQKALEDDCFNHAEIIQKLEAENAALKHLLGTERDNFGKRETKLMATINEMKLDRKQIHEVVAGWEIESDKWEETEAKLRSTLVKAKDALTRLDDHGFTEANGDFATATLADIDTALKGESK